MTNITVYVHLVSTDDLCFYNHLFSRLLFLPPRNILKLLLRLKFDFPFGSDCGPLGGVGGSELVPFSRIVRFTWSDLFFFFFLKSFVSDMLFFLSLEDKPLPTTTLPSGVGDGVLLFLPNIRLFARRILPEERYRRH